MPETIKLFLYPTIVLGPWLLAALLALTLGPSARDRAMKAALLYVILVTFIYLCLRLAFPPSGLRGTEPASMWTELRRILPAQLWGRGPMMVCLSALLLHGRTRGIRTAYLRMTGTFLPWIIEGLMEFVRPSSSDTLGRLACSLVPACGGLVMSWWLLRDEHKAAGTKALHLSLAKTRI